MSPQLKSGEPGNEIQSPLAILVPGGLLTSLALNAEILADLSVGTFWLVLPTLPMFLVLPALLRRGSTFYPVLAASVGVMAVCYLVAVPVLARFGVTI